MASAGRTKLGWLRSAVLIIILIGVGGSLAGFLYVLREEPPRRAVAALPPMVESAVVWAEDVAERYSGYGTARPDRVANIAAEVAATVIELVDELEAGSRVSKGQLLIRLDARSYQQEVARAEALADADQAAIDELVEEAERLKRLIATADTELRVASDERDRLSDLYERDLAAKKEFDFANLAYQRARRVSQGYQMDLAKNGPRQARFAATKRSQEAAAKLASLNVEKCEIKAPFAGSVETLNVEVGDRAALGAVLLTLIDPSHVEIPIQLPASAYHRVAVGAPCRVETEALREVSWEGRIARKAASADERTRTFSAYIDVDNGQQNDPLIPGTFVRAEVRGPVHHDCILVPRGAIRNGHVFVEDGGIARQRTVTWQRLIGDRALVNGDLRSGDRVILSHLDRLAAGSPVRIRPEQATSAAVNQPSYHGDARVTP